MNPNIYRHELRLRMRSVLIWSAGILALHLLYLSFYQSFAGQAALLNQLKSSFPPEFLAAFGMDGADLSQVLGFYSFIFLLVQICLAIQAGNYGFGLVSVEESQRTADFLLTRPVPRGHILVSKALAACTALAVSGALVWADAFVLINLFRGAYAYEPATLALLLAGIPLFQAFFFSVGLAVSLLVGRIRNVTPYGLGLGFGMYALGAFSGMLGETPLEWLTPFKHFDAARIVQRRAYDARFLWLNAAVTLLALAFSYWRYLRRDIPAA